MKSARFLWLLVAGCSWQHPGREQLGDEAWHAARWGDAVEDYRAAGDAPQVTAKLADATFHADLLTESAAAWLKLGRSEPGRAAEAAAGLARVAQQAQQEDKQAALAQAVAGLHELAPTWPLGRLAAWIDQPGALPPELAVAVIPAMLANVTSRDGGDPLLLLLGRAERVQNECDLAATTLDGVLRRNPAGDLHDSASVVLSHCELTLGLAALAAARADDAERWFDEAAGLDSTGPVGRRARIGVGDARLVQGDTAAARAAWRAVTAAATPDSLSAMALVRLQQVATASDSVVVVPPQS